MPGKDGMGARRSSDSDVLPQAVSDRVLARASELDAALRSGASVAQLRTAALEAGISEAAFEAALAEVQRGGSVTEPRRPPWWRKSFLAFAVLFLLAGVGVTALRMILPAPVAPPAAVEIVEEPILLRCLAPEDAGALLAPVMKGENATIRVSSTDGGRVLTVSGTRAQVAEAKDVLARHEATLPACDVPTPPARPVTP